MEEQKSKKIADIREHYKTDIDEIKNELLNADILKNEKLGNILFAKEIENFNKSKSENKQVQNLNDYIVNNIIDRLVDEIYEHITTNNYSFDDFKLKSFLNTNMIMFFRLRFNIKNTEHESEIISISHSSRFKEDSVILPPRKQLFNIEPLTRISVRRAMEYECFKISIFGNKCRCQFQENLGENNKNKQPTLILEKDNNEYNIILNDDGTMTISKKNSEENDKQKLIGEIQSNFSQEDETIKTLFENLEYELTDEQMQAYNKIKELLGYKKPKVKYDLCGMNNYWIGKKTNGRFGCCGW